MNSQTLIGTILVVLALGVYLLFRWMNYTDQRSSTPDLESITLPGYSENWNRDEVAMTSSRMVTMTLRGFEIDFQVKARTMNCITDKMMRWLETTDCADSATPEASGKCLMKAGVDERGAAFLVGCIKETVPNEWKIFSPSFRSSIEEASAGLEPDTARRKKIEDCAFEAILKELNAAPCKPLDMNAKDLWTLTDTSRCPKMKEFDAMVTKHLTACKSTL